MERPDNCLGKAIAALILCWPFGIPAIINAAKVNSLWDQGKQNEAIEASQKAAKFAKISIILGIISIVLSTIYYIVVLVAVS